MKKTLFVVFMAIAALLATTAVFAGTGLNYDQPYSYSYNPRAITTKTATSAILLADDHINADATSAAFTLTLPTIASVRSAGFGNKSYKIVKNDSTTNVVTVAPGTGDTIGGGSTRKLLSNEAYMVISISGNDWKVEYETPYLIEDHNAGTYTTGIGSGGLYSATSGSGTVTLTASDCGNIITMGTGTTTYNLPATVANCKLTFINGVGGGASSMVVNPVDADAIFGGCTLASSVVSIAGAIGDGITNTAATAIKGDLIQLTGSGTAASAWWVTDCQGIFADTN